MDVGTGGHREHMPPHFSKTRAKGPFSCNLVALLENFENAKVSSKIHVSSNFRGSMFLNFFFYLSIYLIHQQPFTGRYHGE